MRDHHAEVGARATRPLLQAEERGDDDPDGERERESGERMPATEGERQEQADGEAHAERPAQEYRELGNAGVLPARERTDAHEEERRRHERHEHRLEVRRPDRDLAHAERVDQQRIKRAEEYRAGGSDEEHVVREQE